ncbi:hydrolase [Paenibacillus oenotherae]|uniref:Hydrolase n=1 Tax=Paenibacillus oenotherae TaxID=1435645 RepID=A0ABS7D448_9BACL|nr:HAD family hydrolase [Paenibacillus oenotherae]MBW7474660.1 hydrolase [Paenibacillus oenotherae]
MIFASDLDQTLIYSERSKGEVPAEDMVPVELYEGRHISFMTKRAVEKLGTLAGLARFIPVTTRIPEQYHRIFGITEGFRPEYAIVSNGGTVLVNGQPDQEWNGIVRDAVRTHCAEQSEIIGLFNAIAASHWVKSSRLCDELFYSIVVERDQLPLDAIEELKKQIAPLGWSYSLQGRKIYLVPEKVSKGAAIQYVKDKLDSGYVFAAGDSLLDESLLLAADFAIAPSHGELGRLEAANPHISFTKSTGALASEELLDIIIERAGKQAALQTK